MENSLSLYSNLPWQNQRTVTRWAVVAFLLVAAPVFAQNTVWTDGTGNWFNGSNWSAGVPDANATALINNGGTAQIMSSGAASGEVEIGVDAQDTGTLTTSGLGNLQDDGSLYVARSGTGTVTILSGGIVSSGRFVIAENSESNGTATVSGSGSTWTNIAVCFVGFDGNATLNVTSGGQLSNSNTTSIGENMGTGVVTVDGVGSSWAEDAQIYIGGSGAGTLTISNGGHVTCSNSTIGSNPGSNGVVNVGGAGSTWTNNGFLALSGNGGDGTLHITSGGAVSNGSCLLGTFSGSGTATVDGVGSTWTVNGDVSIGNDFGVGMLTISQAGQVASANGFVADGSSSTGTVELDGPGSTWTSSGNVFIGGTESVAVGTGLLHLTNGGMASAGAVTIWSTGTVTGDGFIQTANGVTNQGTLAPDQTISITGNLSFTSTAMMLSEVTPNTADNVTVQGMTMLNGHLGVTLSGGPFITGAQYTLLQASGGLNGTAFANTSISAPPGVTAQVTYDVNRVYLLVTQGSSTPTPTPTASPPATATPTPTATVTPTATPTGTPTTTVTPSSTPRITPTPRAHPSPRVRPTAPPHLTPIPTPSSPRPTAWPRPTSPPHITPVPPTSSPRPTPAPRP